ncbi:unnamed protein product, partial [Mesorhabditis belari]|uniref:Uncharacterized protein n=1 Tax=Mesorhabditis belari TaxID=2138241 RepID=A0AAF3EHJ4_9BILA
MESKGKALRKRNSFDFSTLPQILHFFVLDWLHAEEALNVYRSNELGKKMITEYGISLRYISEINLRIEEKSLLVTVFPRDYRRKSIDRQLFTIPFDTDNWKLCEKLNRIKACRCLSLELECVQEDEEQREQITHFLTSHKILKSLHQVHRFYLNGDPELIESFLPNFSLKYLAEVHVTTPFDCMEANDFLGYWKEILKNEALMNCQFLEIMMLEQNPLLVKDFPTTSKHLELNFYFYDWYIRALKLALENNLCVKKSTTLELKDYFDEEDCGGFDLVYGELMKILKSTPGIEDFEKNRLRAKELFELEQCCSRIE